MRAGPQGLTPKQCSSFLAAVRTGKRVTGFTHSFYRYPARFSPHFPAAAIEFFSNHGDLVLDPYMGGGTTIVEALAAGRQVVGNDLNELAVFVARVKTKSLSKNEVKALRSWANCIPQTLNYRRALREDAIPGNGYVTRNLGLYRSRYIKKAIALALQGLTDLPTNGARNFARCAILHVSQSALDGKRRHTSLEEFRSKLSDQTEEMLEKSLAFKQAIASQSLKERKCLLYRGKAEDLPLRPIFSATGRKVDLVVTSPPYPGVHVLYHRWQVDGRKETPAPYWITACRDGKGASHYNFGGRNQAGLRRYFETATATLRAVRSVMKDGAYLVQLIAFSDSRSQLPRYLRALEETGFVEVSFGGPIASGKRIWREVPNRKWHATAKGLIRSAREVVLIHKAC